MALKSLTRERFVLEPETDASTPLTPEYEERNLLGSEADRSSGWVGRDVVVRYVGGHVGV